MNYSDIIAFVIDYINSNYRIRAGDNLKLTFDEMRSDKDSIIFTPSDEASTGEKKDITGLFVDGEIPLNCYYRIMNNDNGYADLDAIQIVNDLVTFIKSNYKLIKTDDFYVSGVDIKSTAKLSTVYQNGVKDFISSFSIKYGRRL